MGSSVYSPFLLPSLLVYIVPLILSGRMTQKVIVIISLVLVGLIEANPVSMEVTKLPDGDLGETADIGFATEDIGLWDDSLLEGFRKKRSTCEEHKCDIWGNACSGIIALVGLGC